MKTTKLTQKMKTKTGCFPVVFFFHNVPCTNSEQAKVFTQLALDQNLMSVESWGELKEKLENNGNVDSAIPEALEKCISPCAREDKREKWWSRNGNSCEERKEGQEKDFEQTGEKKFDKRFNPIISCPKCFQFVPNSIPGKPSKACWLPGVKANPIMAVALKCTVEN